MAVFIYHVEKQGRLTKGKIKAQNLQTAKLKLQSQKIDPVYIKEQSLRSIFSGGGSVKTTVILFFTRQLSFLLTAGVSLIKSLEMCMSTVSNDYFKHVLRGIIRDLKAGKKFAQALRRRPDVFDSFYVNMIVCAEQTGLLDQVLVDLSNYMEKAEFIKSRVKSSMMYPIIVLVISFLIISGVVLFVVPTFTALYGDKSLPALTQALVTLSDAMRAQPLVLLAIVVGIPIGFYQVLKTEGGKKTFRALLLNAPIFGKIQYQASMVRFFRSFHCLLKSGVNFLEALDVAYNIANHPKIQTGILMARSYVLKGKKFSSGLKDSKVFPPLVYNMAKIGEESGKMELTFEKLTSYYEEILDNLITGLIKMIEPLMIVVIGGIIAVLMLALYMPVFNMGDII